MQIREKQLMAINMTYCYLPTLLFLSTWVNTFIGLLAIMGIIVSIYFFFKDIKFEKALPCSQMYLLLMGEAIFAICLFAGMGHLWPQTLDYHKHNAVLQDLVRYEWPVVYTQYDTAILTYYIGQYLFPALVGKLFGSLRVADYMMGLMGITGVILAFINILFVTQADTNKKQSIVLIVFLLFSGMLFPLQHILDFIFPNQLFYPYPHSDVSSVGHLNTLYFRGGAMEYRSIFTDIQWVHQQTIIPWLCTLMFMNFHKQYKYYALIILPAYLSGTWGFLGLILIALISVLVNLIKEKGKIWRDILSWHNIFIALGPCIIFTFYFTGNVLGEKPDSEGFGFDFSQQHLLYWFFFCLFMFGIYVMIIAKKNYRDSIFWATVISLIIFPLSSHCDFIMCTSIPALLILLIYIIEFILAKNTNIIPKTLLIIFLLIGARNPVILIREAAIHKIYDHFQEESLIECTNRKNPEIRNTMKYQYYTYNPESTIFYKYLMKK